MFPSVADYICIFQKTGAEINPLILGTDYRLSNNFLDRKRICETKKLSEDDNGQYIHRDDWISTKGAYSCYLYDMQNNRILDKQGNPVKLHAKSMCDYYHNNHVHDRTTRYEANPIIKPFLQLKAQTRIDFSTLLLFPFLYMALLYFLTSTTTFMEYTQELLLNTFTLLVVIPFTAVAIWLNKIEI